MLNVLIVIILYLFFKNKKKEKTLFLSLFQYNIYLHSRESVYI